MYKTIEELVTRVDERNNGGIVSELIGVSIDKCFIKSVANTNGTDLSKYKIIRKNDFAVSLMQVSRDGKIPVARLEEYEEAIMSPAYPIFRVKDKNVILPEYLEMWFKRPEFDREAAFIADYLPWCVVAANVHPLERHSRKIYTEYCRCTEELQNEILHQAGYKSNSIQGTRWVQKCIMDLEKDIEQYNLGGDYLYDGAKYFHRSYERYRDLQWNGTPSVFEPINKNNKFRRTFNINQLSIGEYVDEYFYYYIDKKMEFNEDVPIPPMDYVWNSQNIANCEEEKVCMWLMELIEGIAIVIRNRKPDEEINQKPLEYTDAQAETFEDKYYEVIQQLYNTYYVSVDENKSKRKKC